MMKIAYDCDLKRPACVLLQAAMGGSSEAAKLFPTESWLLAPTEGLRVYPVTPKQLNTLIQMTKTT